MCVYRMYDPDQSREYCVPDMQPLMALLETVALHHTWHVNGKNSPQNVLENRIPLARWIDDLVHEPHLARDPERI
jgi:hypothetical protein